MPAGGSPAARILRQWAIASTILCFLSAAAWLAAPASAEAAATSYQTSLVPIEADAAPGFSTNGSSIKIISGNHQLQVKGKIKRIVDENGRVTQGDLLRLYGLEPIEMQGRVTLWTDGRAIGMVEL